VKKYFQIGLVAVVVLMLGATLTLADPRSNMFSVQHANVQEGEVYNRDLIAVQNPVLRPTQLPAPRDPDTEAVMYAAAVSKPGPSMFDGFKSDMGGLAPNVGVRGGGMMSARQQADRQIGKLIRQLN
jgi:hypothetical protein